MSSYTHSLVIPVYKNESTLSELINAITFLNRELNYDLQTIFVVDGSPDQSLATLLKQLKPGPFHADVISHTRNFGSFAAIRTGLAHAKGRYIAVMAADLQEPIELILDFFRSLAQGTDVAVGVRAQRDDPWPNKQLSQLFWFLYQKFVQPEMPKGGIDVFGCTDRVRDTLLLLEESHSSLVGQLLWIGYKRTLIPYHRKARISGHSSWSLRRKIRYVFDNIFSFTDLPIMLLTAVGLLGTIFSTLAAVIIIIKRLTNDIPIPGYTAIIITILLAVSLILFALGIVGNYVWRTYENTKRRPLSLLLMHETFSKENNHE